MPTLPEKRYVRRGHVMDYFGLDKREMKKLVAAGVFTPLYLQGRGRAFFARAEVLAAETSGKIFKPTASSLHVSTN